MWCLCDSQHKCGHNYPVLLSTAIFSLTAFVISTLPYKPFRIKALMGSHRVVPFDEHIPALEITPLCTCCTNNPVLSPFRAFLHRVHAIPLPVWWALFRSHSILLLLVVHAFLEEYTRDTYAQTRFTVEILRVLLSRILCITMYFTFRSLNRPYFRFPWVNIMCVYIVKHFGTTLWGYHNQSKTTWLCN